MKELFFLAFALLMAGAIQQRGRAEMPAERIPPQQQEAVVPCGFCLDREIRGEKLSRTGDPKT